MITEEQKRIQEAAAYGLPQNAGLPANYTHEQIEFLRGLIFQHDAQNAAMTREFDLNKPPTPPYRYQEFPRLVYRAGDMAVVKDKNQLSNMLSHGYSITPSANMEVSIEPELDSQSAAEAQAIDARLRQPSVADLLQKIAALEARLETAPEPTEKQQRSQRASRAAKKRWAKRKPAPSASPAVEDGQ
jgi:hypothetical protein